MQTQDHSAAGPNVGHTFPHNNISLETKVIEKSLDSKINFDSIDNANAYYSERYGWTLRKN